MTSKSKAAKRTICNLFRHIKSLAQLWKIKLKRKKKHDYHTLLTKHIINVNKPEHCLYIGTKVSQ